MHTTLAVSATGLPLGVLALGFDPVKTLSKEKEKRRKTQRWLEGFNATADAARENRPKDAGALGVRPGSRHVRAV